MSSVSLSELKLYFYTVLFTGTGWHKRSRFKQDVFQPNTDGKNEQLLKKKRSSAEVCLNDLRLQRKPCEKVSEWKTFGLGKKESSENTLAVPTDVTHH